MSDRIDSNLSSILAVGVGRQYRRKHVKVSCVVQTKTIMTFSFRFYWIVGETPKYGCGQKSEKHMFEMLDGEFDWPSHWRLLQREWCTHFCFPSICLRSIWSKWIFANATVIREHRDVAQPSKNTMDFVDENRDCEKRAKMKRKETNNVVFA